MLKTLLSNVKQYKKVAILTPVCAALEVVMETLIPYITADLIDKGVTAGDMSQTVKYGIIMVVMAFCSLFFAVTAGRCAAKASTGFAANLRGSMYRKIQTFSFANIDKFSTGGLITRMTSDVNNIQQAFQMSMRMAVRAPFTLICSMIMCFVIDSRIALVFLGVIFLLVILIVFIVSKVAKRFSVVMQKYDDLNANVQENVSAIRVVKAFVREDYEIDKFKMASSILNKASIKAEKILTLSMPIMTAAVNALLIIVSWMAAHFITSGTMTTGELTSMFTYIASVMMSLMMLSAVVVFITMSIASGKRIAEVLDEVPTINEPENPVMEIADGSISFENVGFEYKLGTRTQVLRNINIDINSGETLGIIGGTGSGKSSFIRLISRLYDVSSGSVKVGGVDVRNYDLDTLRNGVSVVLQNNVLFSGTILDNLRWGKEDATLEECEEACKAACAHDFIKAFPEGYDTQIDQGGTNVSGGQKQRLCIARAILKNPKILILDDSTSAVDTGTDASIRKSLKEIIPGTTKLIIAQRIASVMDADRILVLEDGTISGLGTHEELLQNNSIYKEIYETQMNAGGDFDETPGRKEEQ